MLNNPLSSPHAQTTWHFHPDVSLPSFLYICSNCPALPLTALLNASLPSLLTTCPNHLSFTHNTILGSFNPFQAVNPLNNIINDPNEYSILGRIVRITDDVILYRQWIQKTFPVSRLPVTSTCTHHVTPAHPATPPTPPVEFHAQNSLKVCICSSFKVIYQVMQIPEVLVLITIIVFLQHASFFQLSFLL